MDLAHGGHLTHGMHLNFSGKLYKVVRYGVTHGRRAHRLRPGRRAGPRAQAEAGRRRGQRLPARDRLRRVRRDLPARSGRCSWWTWPTSPAWSPAKQHPDPVPCRRLRHLDDAQDAARPARRLRPVQGGLGAEDQLGGLPRHAGRAADARHRRQGGRASARRCSRRSRPTRPRSIANAKTLADELHAAGLPPRLRRHRQPPAAGGRGVAAA